MTDDAGIGRLLRVAFPTPPDDECIAATLARLGGQRVPVSGATLRYVGDEIGHVTLAGRVAPSVSAVATPAPRADDWVHRVADRVAAPQENPSPVLGGGVDSLPISHAHRLAHSAPPINDDGAA